MTVTWNTGPVEEQMRQAAQRAVVRTTEAVRTEAVRLILNTPKTGELYWRTGISQLSKSGGSFSGGHRVSAPGEAPASDTGTLVGRIRTDYTRIGSLVGVVVASTDYAAHLEYGTQRIEPRPFMRPALANMRGMLSDFMSAEVRGVFRPRNAQAAFQGRGEMG